MPLRRLIRRLFPKRVPRSADLGELGVATSDPYGGWAVERPVVVGGHRVGLCFNTGERPPGDAEVDAYRRVAAMWPGVWSAVTSRLRNELADDGPNGERERFLSKARPVGLIFIQGLDKWEVILEPDIYGGHRVTMMMNGSECEGFRLDG